MADVKILLVEDENIEALDIKRTLESFGYEVPYVVSSGEEAVEKALAIMPDLILMDIILKGDIDGIEAVSKIKDLNIPVIYLTAHSEESTIERAKLTEPDGYIIKPYDRTELKYAIELAIYKNKLKNKLKDSETKYRTLFNQAADGILLMEGDKFIECNDRALEIYGTNKKQLIGKTPYTVFSPEVQPNKEISEDMAIKYINKALDGRPQHFEWEHLQYDGTPFYTEISLNRLKIKGQYLLQAIVRDITDRKQAENELKKSHNKEQLQAEIIRDASVSIGIGYPDGKLGFVNKAFEKLTGYSEEELKTINWNVELTPEKWRLNEQKCLDELQQSKKSVQYEKEYIKKDGSIVPIELVVNPHLDTKGNIDHYFSFITNITERKEAEEALQDSENEYHDLFNHLNSGIAVYEAVNNGKDFIFKDFNTAAENIEHVQKEDVIGKKLTETFLGVKDFGIFDVFQRVWKTGKSEYFPENIYKDEKDLGSWRENWVYKLPNGKIVAIYNNINERKTAEKALKENEKSYRELVDNSLVGVYKTNLQGDILFVNDAMAKIFHYDNIDELKENNIIKLYKNKDDRIKLLNKLKKEGKVNDYELETRGKNGQSINMLVSVSLKDDILFGMFMDITQLKKAEKNLLEGEKRFRTLINNSTDLIRILDKKGYIIYDSPSSESILGYPEGSLIGKSPLEFIHPDDLERVKNDLAEVYENRNPGIPTEFRIRKADGEYLHVESISQNMIHVPNIEGIVVTTHPIQQRKEMEDTLRESEEKYHTLFETDPSYTLLIGTDGIIQDVNKATSDITGLSREELIGKHFIKLDLAIPEDIPVYVENITQILKGEQIKPFESQFRDKNGKIRWGFITLTPIIKDKSISSIMAIISDFTDRKVAENQLKTTIKEKEVLLREIHHRVKNNMQIISSLLNLQTQHVEGEETINVLKESQGRVKSMAMIHEKLYQSPTFNEINFKEYIRKLVSDIFYSYGIKAGTIESVLNIGDININIDTAIPLGLIINELVTNSVKYAFPQSEGIITVKLSSQRDQLELIIADDGIGFSEDIDIENTETLGLQLVTTLVNQLDGQLELTKKEGGTEFKIIFKELKYKERS
ncbi:PAS domain S-box protein [Methanobacterium spitsbergense]|uniref:PAS domain S-box protein n=1 Tax=Methanobacterium spitsbergense TaxID=2874285 RepID=A0A8T5V564_9EURY|nr:PAS domain S-box protein [Methanobacterium spitsbergense]MBZ2166805.1 PAS domain S-box protein [Methanobacterium spitsbergense]